LKRFDSQNARNAETKTYLQKPVNKRIKEGFFAKFEKEKKEKKQSGVMAVTVNILQQRL
jgi:hypothetical protein